MTEALTNRPSVLDATAFLRLLSLRAREARVAQTASSLAFLSLLAVVPMVAIAFAVLTILPAFGDLRGSLQAFFASQLFPPAFSETVVRYVNQFASKADKLSVVGIFVLFLTALSALRTIERTLDGIWGVADRRPWAHRRWNRRASGSLLHPDHPLVHLHGRDKGDPCESHRGIHLRECRSRRLNRMPAAIILSKPSEAWSFPPRFHHGCESTHHRRAQSSCREKFRARRACSTEPKPQA
jgi:hypothetical protein